MLTSSDAKWRCLWHMLVWSLLLTLVSQFLQSQSHVAFYIFAGFSLVGLPVLTAVYSNTAGKHGASLLRAGYVFGDPVIACLTLTPPLLFTKLPLVVSEHLHTVHCTNSSLSSMCLDTNASESITRSEDFILNRDELIEKQRKSLAIIQASVVVPPLVLLLMGRRTHKMRLPTYLLSFLYWLVTSIEAVDLIDYTLINTDYQHIIYTTETIVTIVKTITHSYAVVTLCSFITPANTQQKKRGYSAKFELLYQAFVIISGTLFTEIPLVVARVCIMSVDFNRLLPAQFYIWLIKDCLVIAVLVTLLISQRIGARKNNAFPCKLHLDNPNVFFQPEKRDEYIVKKRVRFQEPLVSTQDNHIGVDLLTVCLSSVDTASALSVSHESGMEILGFAQQPSESRMVKMASAPSLSATCQGPVATLDIK